MARKYHEPGGNELTGRTGCVVYVLGNRSVREARRRGPKAQPDFFLLFSAHLNSTGVDFSFLRL